MKMRIAQRVSLAIGLLLFLFFMNNAVSFLLTKRIDDSLAGLGRAQDPREELVLDMEALVVDTYRYIGAYSHLRRPRDKERALQAEESFSQRAAQLVDLSKRPAEIALVRAVVAAFNTYKELSTAAAAAVDKEHGEHVALRKHLGRVRATLGGLASGASTQKGPAAQVKFNVAFGMTAASSELLRSVEEYRIEPNPDAREAVAQTVIDFNRAFEAYGRTDTSAEEKARLLKIGEDWTAARTLSEAAMATVGEKQRLGEELKSQRDLVQLLLSEKISPIVQMVRKRARAGAGSSADIAMVYILIMTGVGVICGIGTAIVLTRGIVRPISELKASADAIGRGVLEHRIPVISDDEIGQLALSFNQMAENRQRSEEALRELAHHDPLTKLPNRSLFHRRLLEAIDNARRVNRMVAVHYIDLDHFKNINDTLGHPSGDALLRLVSERLKGCARASDTVARLGGDEFAIIQTNLLYYNGIAVLAKRVVETLAKPFDIDGERVFTGGSVGITVFPYDGTETEQLLKNADLALYQAKKEGRNNYQLYDPDMNAEIQTRRLLERDLREALDKNQFFLTYQPQVELATGRIIGAEALVRWRHPERGLVSPADFIPVAEQTGLIIQLTERVIRTACRQIKAWQDAGMPAVRVSVNLSPADFKRKDLIPMITSMLEKSGVEPSMLELEITEGMVMSGVENVIETLNELKAMGLELAIDDFGTGYSSMNYLKQFSVDRLKIDQSFVRDIPDNKEDAGITQAIIKLGHSIGLRVIAEGVETAEQLAYLRAQECDEVQGYFFSRPVVAKEFMEFVTNYVPEEVAETQRIA